jgi:hypothetical protein
MNQPEELWINHQDRAHEVMLAYSVTHVPQGTVLSRQQNTDTDTQQQGTHFSSTDIIYRRASNLVKGYLGFPSTSVVNRPVRPRFLQDGRDGAKAVRPVLTQDGRNVGRHPPSSGGYCLSLGETKSSPILLYRLRNV